MTDKDFPEQLQKSIVADNNNMTVKDAIQRVRNGFAYLKSKWLIILATGFIGGLIGFGYAFIQQPTYTATVTFAMEDDKGSGGMSGAMSFASAFGIDLGTSAGGAFSGANLIELMKSRRLVEQTLLQPVASDNQSLADYYISISGARKAWQSNPQFAKMSFTPDSDRSRWSVAQDSILGNIYNALIANNLVVGQKDKKVGIISIEVKSTDQMFAKIFAEKLASVVSSYYVEIKSAKAKLNVEILQRQTDSIRGELNSALNGVASANDYTYNLNPALNIKRVPSVRRQVDVQANTALLTQLVTNLELAKVSLRKETPLIQVIDLPILPLPKDRMSRSATAIKWAFLFGFVCMFWLLTKRLFDHLTS